MAKDSCVEIENTEDRAVISFKQQCITDVEQISAAADHIRDFIDRVKPRLVVFDFENVKFFSSQVLGLLLAARQQLQELNGEVVVCAIDPQLHRIFRITNLDRIFKFFPDRSSAVHGDRQEANST